MSLTAQQIVTLACQIAKTPGMTSQAGQLLNSILSELCQNYDFELTLKTHTFQFYTGPSSGQYIAGCGPNDLPADFLRVKNNEAIFYIQGVRYVMISLDQAQFDALVQTAGFNSYPVNFWVDVSPIAAGDPAQLFVWPPASGAFTTTVRYYSQMADIATPETSSTVPWFPNTNYLMTRLAGELMKITNDDRVGAFLGDSDQAAPLGAGTILRRYLKLKDDPEGRVNTVKKDRRLFGPAFNKLPNTKIIGWTFAINVLGGKVLYDLGAQLWMNLLA